MKGNTECDGPREGSVLLAPSGAASRLHRTEQDPAPGVPRLTNPPVIRKYYFYFKTNTFNISPPLLNGMHYQAVQFFWNFPQIVFQFFHRELYLSFARWKNMLNYDLYFRKGNGVSLLISSLEPWGCYQHLGNLDNLNITKGLL